MSAGTASTSLRQKYSFLLSSFASDEKESLAKKIDILGGTYTETPHFITSCTHIVCNKPNRGEKFLCGCATGKWLLRKEYLEDSFAAQQWLDEELYEWNDACNVPGLRQDHVSAPMRWRKLSEKERGPFDGWNVLVLVNDAKRRIAYKRLLAAGQARILNGKPGDTYMPKLAKKLTHVFVEKSLECDVEGLAKAGVPCLSPDYIPEYILRHPKPCKDEFSISIYTHLTSTTAQNKSHKDTPEYPTGSYTNHRTRIQDLLAKCPKKRLSGELPAHQMSPTKKAKLEGFQFITPKWLDLSFTNPTLGRRMEQKQNVSSHKTQTPVSAFPDQVLDSVSSYMDASHEISAIDLMGSFLSDKCHPSDALIHIMMNKLLLKASTIRQAVKAYSWLQKLLYLHPPSTKSCLYLSALTPPEDNPSSQVFKQSTEWAYLSNVASMALGLSDNINPPAGVPSRQTETSKPSYDKSLVWRILWPNGMGSSINCHVRALFRLTWKACTEVDNQATKMPVLNSLQNMVAMVAACCEYADQDTNTPVALIGTRMSSLATEMMLTCGQSHEAEGPLRLFLETCRPSWLKMKVTEIMLGGFDDCLVPQVSKDLLARGLSLKKIVNCYFFLLPRDATTLINKDATEVKSKTHTKSGRDKRASVLQVLAKANTHYERTTTKKTSTVNRRNIRGETPLHVACIRNDPAKVNELISQGADVNLVDNAGWTPLHEACNHGNVACVKEILKVRPIVYEKREAMTGLYILSSPICGTTPLHDAAVNGHLEVTKLLVAAGGLPLLEVKNATGLRPYDVAASLQMKLYLSTKEHNLKNKPAPADIMPTGAEDHRLPTPEMYDHALGKKGRHINSRHIPPGKCELYLLILSHLVQSFARIHNHYHVDMSDISALKNHVQRIIAQENLTVLCSIRVRALELLSKLPV
ncbi:uncharacterized protein LOC5513685 isoform X2 [Nematostella vectensis]|uniref:uncharacterized protein LOC5513685 isoform X2 n=1 Tax=Nematostella vectensis TaxID=45351 RepID=UPI0013901DFD|nr:uncharacterized protein LOC5513685 isoform X2 [Nematostella vectensis]